MSASRLVRLKRAAVLSPPLLWTFVFMFVPYAILFVYSFWVQKYPTFVPDFQFGNYIQIATDPQYLNVILRTLKIAFFVSLGAALIAYPYAYFLVFKVKSPGVRMALYMAVVAPLWVSYLLRAYTWKTILGTTGILNSFLMSAGILSEPSSVFLYNQTAMVVTLTYVFIPFMVMPIYAVLEKIPRNLTEASSDLGVGRFRTVLSRSQLEKAEVLLASVMEAGGYASTTSERPATQLSYIPSRAAITGVVASGLWRFGVVRSAFGGA